MPYDRGSLNNFVQRQGGNLSTLGQSPTYTGAPAQKPMMYQPNQQGQNQQGQNQQGPMQQRMMGSQMPMMRDQMQSRGAPQYPLRTLGMQGQQMIPQQAMHRQAMIQRGQQQRAAQQRMAMQQRIADQQLQRRNRYSPIDRMMQTQPPLMRR